MMVIVSETESKVSATKAKHSKAAANFAMNVATYRRPSLKRNMGNIVDGKSSFLRLCKRDQDGRILFDSRE